ncbi:hypothetical protein NC651_034161 [Populus alba x Populus x berolinensis]|nr:hypothetical protein NC651_034161 [Populus alba x Populus x berolinensis]
MSLNYWSYKWHIRSEETMQGVMVSSNKAKGGGLAAMSGIFGWQERRVLLFKWLIYRGYQTSNGDWKEIVTKIYTSYYF